jgi:hypothetical protein
MAASQKPPSVMSPTWSPDGTYVAFLVYEDPPINEDYFGLWIGTPQPNSANWYEYHVLEASWVSRRVSWAP